MELDLVAHRHEQLLNKTHSVFHCGGKNRHLEHEPGHWLDDMICTVTALRLRDAIFLARSETLAVSCTRAVLSESVLWVEVDCEDAHNTSHT